MVRSPWPLLALAALLRLLVCWRTGVPGRDGGTYLWMAERLAAGDPSALFATVFHPLYPALVGAAQWGLPGLDPVLVGQAVAAGLGALAVVPLWRLALHFADERAAFWCGLGYATSAWFARHPAECMSEGPFYLCAAVWANRLLGASPRPLLAGIAAALAYLLRPEGAALLGFGGLWSLRQFHRRGAVAFVTGALPLAVLLPLGFARFGSGFTLTPKAAFNYDVGIGAADAPLAHYLDQALALPLAAAEEFGFGWLPMIVLGVLALRPRRLVDPAALLLAPFVLQCLLVPLLHAHWRFLSGFGALLFVFAGAGVTRTLAAAARRGRGWVAIALALLLASELRIAAARNPDTDGERALGAWLRSQLQPGETLASDMPRLYAFAGREPPPPRPIEPADLLARAGAPSCRYVCLIERVAGEGDEVRRRTAVRDEQLAALGFAPAPRGTPPAAPTVRVFARPRGPEPSLR